MDKATKPQGFKSDVVDQTRTAMKFVGMVLGLSWILPMGAMVAVPLWGANAAEQPTAIFHAHDQFYADLETSVCTIAEQGYSHVQIAPAQKSNPAAPWWSRYQPIDHRVIEGRGSEAELRSLIETAHGCNIKVIADVVFNHMANMPEFADLNFPTFGPADFQPFCETNYFDRLLKWTMHSCWLGDLPDLDVSRDNVQQIHKNHLQLLLNLGVDGFRFDAAKHMPQAVLQTYIDVVNEADTWNYLEVIEDVNTQLEEYSWIAAVSDFRLYQTLRQAFSFGGDLRSLRLPTALNDSRSVTFARNHDTVLEINDHAVYPYDSPADAHLATAYVLAREGGTPLVLNIDNFRIAYLKYGVQFRKIMGDRADAGANTQETVLAAIDSPTALLMERGEEGFFLINKAAREFDIPVLDLTQSNLEGCYEELRFAFTVAIEWQDNDHKIITRWGTWERGGVEIEDRDALYFVRVPWAQCQSDAA
ncbi:MAG: alpha-amylase family glycosyl hydrolase [Cyanobacteria bacterium J06642_9]